MKKICIPVCLILMFSFCFGGCGSHAQKSSGDSSAGNSSKQEESSQTQESSKAEVSSMAESDSAVEESSVAEESSQTEDTAWASAYLEIVEELQAEYGEGRTITQNNSEGFVGLVVVSLIDFDLDGQPELFCGYLSEDNAFGLPVHQTVYGYAEGKRMLLFNEDASMTGGVNPGSNIWVTSDSVPYILMFNDDYSYFWGLKNGKFEVIHQYCSGALSNPPSWDGKEMTKEEAQTLYDSFMEESTSPILVRYIDVSLGNGMNTLADTQNTIEQLYELSR